MLWLIAFVVLLVLEIATVNLVSIWFSIGTLVAFVVSFFTDVLWVQILVFLLVSLILVIFTRPIANRYLNQSREKTNVDAVVGRHGIVTEAIDNLNAAGEVSLSGQMWMARSMDDNIKIPEGAKVVVKEIRGVKLIVEEQKEDM